MSVYKRLKSEREQIYKIPDSRLGKNDLGLSRLINILIFCLVTGEEIVVPDAPKCEFHFVHAPPKDGCYYEDYYTSGMWYVLNEDAFRMKQHRNHHAYTRK